MGLYRHFPYTNFHELNLDWFLAHFDEIMAEWELYKNKIDDKIDELDAFKEWFEQWTSAEIDNTVWDWLTTHPEAITMNWFVTPQMYGALGNGINDDTNAFKASFNSGKQVIVPVGNYRLSETLITDEAILYIDKGIYPDNKLICSKNITKSPVNAYNLENKNLEDFNLVGLQGCCYNLPHNSIIYSSNLSRDDNNPILVEYSISLQSIARSMKDTNYGHINDITFNPDNNKYYIITGDANKIAIANENFTYLETIELDLPASSLATQISYDYDNKVFFVNTRGNGLFVFNADMTLLKRINNGYVGELDYPYEHIADYYPQGSTVLNGQFISIMWLWGADGSPSYGRLIQYDYVTGEIKQINDVVFEYGNEEPEALYTIGDYIYMVSYFGSTMSTAKITTENNNIVIRNGNTIIPMILNSTTHEGVEFNNMQMYGYNGIYYFQGEIRNNGETITEGTAVANYLKGLSHLYGVGLGYTGSTLIEVVVDDNNVAFKPINGDFPATWYTFVRGFIKFI